MEKMKGGESISKIVNLALIPHLTSEFIGSDSVKEWGGTGVDIGGVSIAMSWLPLHPLATINSPTH